MAKNNDPAITLRQYIDAASRVVVFTGAGISTESGIPDFRSPGGIWTTNQPIMFDDFVSSAEIRKEAWRRKLNIDRTFKTASPNRGHRAARGKLGKVEAEYCCDVVALPAHSATAAAAVHW